MSAQSIKHVVSATFAFATAFVLIWTMESFARPLVTEFAMMLRALAFMVFGFGPGAIWLIQLEKARRRHGHDAPPSTWRDALFNWTSTMLIFALCITLAARAFPGPWLSSD